VKWHGEGVKFVFRDPSEAVAGALDMVAAIPTAGLPPAHVGVHSGPVVLREGDYYGQTVNMAARIAEYARPGEVLVSETVAKAAAVRDGVSLSPIGEVELKGVTGATRLFAARRA
jgi:adenylate cyclase